MSCKECKNDKLLDIIFEDLKEIKQDIKSILKFKWSIIAVIGFISFLCSSVLTYFFKE